MNTADVLNGYTK